MWNRNTTVAAAGILAVALMGACADAPLTEPRAAEEQAQLFGAPQDPQNFDGHQDVQLVRIAREVPGFAGYYRGEDGTLRVVMKGGASAAPLRGRLGSFTVVEGQYDFLELDAAHRAVMPVLGLAGVVYSDSDEVANRVVVGVENEQTAAAVRQAAAMLDLDGGILVTRIVEPIYPMGHTLQGAVSPRAGGLKISFGIPGSPSPCTLGFNVRPANPCLQHIDAFVTASHCTVTPYMVDGGSYWQPGPADFIGTEEHDAPLIGGLRWSDAASVRYAPGVDNAFGKIYRTTGVNNGIIDINHPPFPSMFTITAELLLPGFPVVGDEMNKVGQSTGWTSGVVAASCVNVFPPTPGATLLCQQLVAGAAGIVGAGDSGSPVFDNVNLGSSTVRLVGLLWGGNLPGTLFVFSTMHNVRCDNPGPWITYPGQVLPPPGTC
jgi:hypothetical protein